jgi:HSP20 family protein
MASDSRKEQHARPAAMQRRPRHESDDWTLSPFSLMRQGIDEMDRWFSRLTGAGRGSMAPWTAGRDWMTSAGQGDWMPAIEAFQRGSEFVIRAEVPGMKRNEINVEAGDDSITIRGERRQEHSEDREGMFWSERSYGSFSRTIPLPPGAISDSAKASFNNGVLEIVMQAPSQEARRGRKIDISGTPNEGEKK